MSEFSELARDPRYRRKFEKMLFLAAKRGDADLVAQRLSWGIDPNWCSARGTTPLIANARGYCPSSATVRALLQGGADPGQMDATGLTALDYARRKLAKLQSKPSAKRRRSESLDENGQLQLSAEEQEEFDRLRSQLPLDDPQFFRIWWQERLRVARRVFNDPEEVEKIVALLEAADRDPT